MKTELLSIRTSTIHPGDSLTSSLEGGLERSRLSLRSGDILAVASKVVSTSENRIVSLDTQNPSKRALRLAGDYDLEPEFVQVIVSEADKIYGGVTGAMLTLKDGFATANAGVDRKNAPDNSVVLWPRNPRKSALRLQARLKKRTGKDVGIIVVDSRVTPLRLGTVGLSLAGVGFRSIKDFRTKPDLNNRKIRITFQSLSDGLAAAAHVLMGEARERTPFVLIRGAPVEKSSNPGMSEKMRVEDCLFMSQISGRSGKVI